jgi:hypothetical protein
MYGETVPLEASKQGGEERIVRAALSVSHMYIHCVSFLRLYFIICARVALSYGESHQEPYPT